MHRSLSSWLAWQETLHPSSIDLGLDRMREVLQRLRFQSPACPVITIAGTKGKGSCAAILSSIYGAAGYRAGLLTSPHLQRYNERIRISGAEVSDESLCAAFERIDVARGEISLTYFEFNTLAALLIFDSAELDIWILEVGMGGRLDAVNIIDADVAIVTSIGLDHTEWLGNDVESIAREKAGIFRSQRPALYGAEHMPVAIQTVANEVQASLIRAGEDFGFEDHGGNWSWWMKNAVMNHQLDQLPVPGIAGAIQLQNASVVLTAVQMLSTRLPIARDAIDRGLRNTHLAGRFQRIQSDKQSNIEWILDVAHNPMSASVLAQHFRHWNKVAGARKTIAIIGMLSGKDVHGTVEALCDVVDEWIVVGLGGARALTTSQMVEQLQNCGVNVVASLNNMDAACETAVRYASPSTRILVCGSFLAVGPALSWLEQAG